MERYGYLLANSRGCFLSETRPFYSACEGKSDTVLFSVELTFLIGYLSTPLGTSGDALPAAAGVVTGGDARLRYEFFY